MKRFFELIGSFSFINAALCSVGRILKGFFLALLAGILLAVFSGTFNIIKFLVSPLMTVMKSVPVASFVILALLWFDSDKLSTFIAFIMVCPIIYLNVLSGITSSDMKMKEMSKVFKLPVHRRIMYVYMPYIIPFFKSGCSVALGLCWKAGIAAERIGVPRGTIGEQLYFSKIYFEMSDVFALTVAIILISTIFEKLFMFCLNMLVKLYERA